MKKTPDEIKKGLECCVNDMEPGDECEGCPYFENPSRFHWICHGNKVWSDALALIQQLQDENAEKDAKIQQLEADKQQLEGLLTHMNQLRDAAAGRALSMEERVHQLEAERDAAVDTMPRWISVEERLPEDGDDVAAIIRWNENVWEYGIAFRCNGKWLVNGEGIVTVTHWMPLPEPPKEE